MNELTPHGMPYAEIPNDQVASCARQFRETADFLSAHLTQCNCVSPLLMIATFGIELFLKSLNSRCVYHQDEVLGVLGVYRVTADALKKGHRLVSLLDEIDDSIREGLEDAYAKNPVFRSKTTLRDALSDYDTLFESARYPFEDNQDRGGKNITGLIALLDLIADHVGSLRRQVLFRDSSGS